MAYVRVASEPELPPPPLTSGPLAWARENLFSTPANAATTFVLLALAAWLLPPLFDWGAVNAVWSAPDGEACRAHPDGACWAFIGRKLGYL
ncbi:MAG: amino acid ABC transporter permease, partial [Pseudomonadota bacterium]|nr:amino acid ABC transporter permease [Pseudomonadota bacterium]